MKIAIIKAIPFTEIDDHYSYDCDKVRFDPTAPWIDISSEEYEELKEHFICTKAYRDGYRIITSLSSSEYKCTLDEIKRQIEQEKIADKKHEERRHKDEKKQAEAKKKRELKKLEELRKKYEESK